MLRPSSLVHLYRVRLRARAIQELLALIGIIVGVALVFAALVANTSLTRSIEQLTNGLFGDTRFQLAARGADGFDERLLGRVLAIDGVRSAAPIVEVRAEITGRNGRRSIVLVGGDPRLARIGGALLQSFTASELAQQRALALPAPIADELGIGLYGAVGVETGVASATLPLAAALQRKEIGSLVHGPVGIVPIRLAQQLSGTEGRVSRIFVEPRPGRDADVEQALRRLAAGRLNVLPADFDATVFSTAAYPTSQSTAMFSVFSALVGFLFAVSAVLLTLPQRRRLVADLRLAGYEPLAQVQLLAFDALALGVVGSLLGLAFGDQLSRHLFSATPGYLAYAFPIGSERIVTTASIAIAVAAGIVAACVAVMAPLRDILMHPAAEPRPERPSMWTPAIAGGAVCLAATTAVVLFAPRAALAGLFTLTVALLLLLPVLLRFATAGFARVTNRVRSPVPVLAVLQLRSDGARMRTLALAATGAIAVFATVAIGGAHADLERGLDAAATDVDTNADIWVTLRSDASTFAVSSFRADARDAIAAVPGVRSVGIYRGSFLDIDDHRVWIQAPPRTAPTPIPRSQLREGDVELATRRIRAGGWVVLSSAVAEIEGVQVGDRVTLPTPVPTTLEVAAISTNIGWPSGAVVMNADDYARAWGTDAPSALLVQLAPGSDPDRVAGAVRRAARGPVQLETETQAQRIARHRASTRDGLERLTQISVLVLVSAMLAMAAAMGGMIWQRRPALAALKVHGFPEGELWRALLLESGLLLGTGCLIGAVFGLYGQLLLSRALETITGFPVVYSTAGVVAVAILALVTTVAVAMLAIPGWFAVRVRPSPSASA